MKKVMVVPVPKFGQDIYVDSTNLCLYPKDPIGGRANVNGIEERISSDGKSVHFVSVAEHPGNFYRWEGYLAPIQAKLKKKFGRRRARLEPNSILELTDL